MTNRLPDDHVIQSDKTAGLMLVAPFPWFGGKRRCAHLVWPRLGDVPNYVEPFAGSLANLLLRPHWPFDPSGGNHMETVNDLDGCVTNAWRAIQHDPEQTAVYADNPVHELDLHARHLWLHRRLKSTEGLDARAVAYAEDKGVLPFAARLTMDPDAYDCRVAGWWIWGLCSWIGDNWCRPSPQSSLPHLASAGMGVNRKLPHLGDAGRGVNRKHPQLANAGIGVNRHLPQFGNAGPGECACHRAALIEWFLVLADRLRHVDVCCGDWERVCGLSPTECRGSPCGIFLDPPYSQDAGLSTVYGEYHDPSLSARVREWAIERGKLKDMRIALCGYDTEHEMPADWECIAWKPGAGYGAQRKDGMNANAHRERIWFSPGCLKPGKGQLSLFDPDAKQHFDSVRGFNIGVATETECEP
jgi:hypothetical protein